MKPHYRKIKGYRRHPGRNGRPVYLMPMSRSEVREIRLLISLIGIVTMMVGAGILWAVSPA